MTFFILLICDTLSQFYSITSLVLFTKNNNKLWNEKKVFFLFMVASAYRVILKEVENRVDTIAFLGTHVCLNNPC